MYCVKCDVVVIGGGRGTAAAVAAKEEGAEKVDSGAGQRPGRDSPAVYPPWLRTDPLS